MTLEDKFARIENIFVETKQIKEVMEDIEEAILVSSSSNYASQPICTLVLGLSGVGKTSLMEHFEKKYPRQTCVDEEGEFEHIPVLTTTLTDDKNPRAAPSKMLRDIGDPLQGEGGTRSVLGDRFIGLVKGTKTKCIFIDEFQHAFGVNNDNQKAGAANWIKNIINQSKRPIVLFGLPWCRDVVDTSSELKNRFDNIHIIDEFDREEDSFAEWVEVLRNVDEQLPFEHSSGLDDPELAFRLMVLTGGNLSKLMKKVIKPAARKGVTKNESKLEFHRLLTASKKHLGVPEQYNPLSSQIDINKLAVNHFLTEEENILFTQKCKKRSYVIVKDEQTLSDIFRKN